jgi:hypothetical protein
MNIIEKEIIKRVVFNLHEAGWILSSFVSDGYEEPCRKFEDALNYLTETDEGRLYFTRERKEFRQWVYFILSNGNNGEDVIADYTIGYPDFAEILDKLNDHNNDTNWTEFLMERLERYENRNH